jgi:DinB superfamily
MKTTIKTLLITVVVLLGIAQSTAAQPPELGQGWLPEFNLTARQITELAEATPVEKFSWRPAPGVRSTSEVYMHIALGNYFLLGHAGVKVPIDLSKLPKDPEKSISAKAEVIKFLRDSLDTVRTSYPTADRAKKVQFFGRDATADGVFLRILVHNHEHMGQAIAYARMSGVVPPWSTGGAVAALVNSQRPIPNSQRDLLSSASFAVRHEQLPRWRARVVAVAAPPKSIPLDGRRRSHPRRNRSGSRERALAYGG